MDNRTRADLAETSLALFVDRTCATRLDRLHPEDHQDAIADLICSLLHYAALNGFDPQQAFRSASCNYAAERAEEGHGQQDIRL